MNQLLTVVLVLAIAAALWSFRRARRTMDLLEKMLDEAMDGRFSEQHFNESRLSRAESRLAHYLSASAISAGHTALEKARIQSLISDISHQTKTPLSNVMLYTQLLAEQDLSEEGRECAAALEEQTRKLQFLMDTLVKTSRLETGLLALRPVKGPLLPMLEDAVKQFVPRAEEKNITLQLSHDQASAVFDRKWTAEAICNLLDNAVKYTPEGGNITVRTTAFEMFRRISIADTGPGIPEDEQPKIFQRFYRAPAVRETEGIGVGLYLARQIAEGQGGYIKVSSSPGKDTVFSLFLPAG